MRQHTLRWVAAAGTCTAGGVGHPEHPCLPKRKQVGLMDHGPAAPRVQPRARPRAARSARQRLQVPTLQPLPLVLILQAVLSLRLIRADTALQDEALSLWAGHLEWANLLHSTPVPQFPSYFSGAPVIYPPLA